MEPLRVAEIFSSIQGESHFAGYPCTFVRLSGCNLSCAYCDTRYAREEGRELALAAIVAEVRSLGLRTVEVTGGEPLFQPGAAELLWELVGAGHRVLLETNGSLPIEEVPPRVHVVMDLKAPSSGMERFNRWENLGALKSTDELKIVVAGREDYEWSRAIALERGLLDRFRLSLSPAVGAVAPAELAGWMLADRFEARFQLQLHRVLWPDRDRGV